MYGEEKDFLWCDKDQTEDENAETSNAEDAYNDQISSHSNWEELFWSEDDRE